MLSDPPTATIQYSGVTFKLVAESRWAVQYDYEDYHLVLSKIMHGTFDWSYFEVTSPSDLDEDEQHQAATAIFGVQDCRIPKEWMDYATNLCGAGSTRQATWNEDDDM